MNAGRMAAAGALILALGAGAWVGISQLVENSPITAAQLVASTQADKQSLLDGIREGRPLYYKYDDFRKGRIGPSDYPDRVVQEEWLRAGEDGSLETVVATMRSLEGELLGYTLVSDGVWLYTDVATGMTFDMNVDHWGSLESSVNAMWDGLLTIHGPDVEFKGRGSLHQRESLIYERSRTSQGGPDEGAQQSLVSRIELVEEAPLLNKYSLYEIDDQGARTLVAENTVIEYRLLPEGSAIPTVPDDGT